MVVGSLIMRWSACAPPPAAKQQRYLVRLHVARLDGFSLLISGESRAVVALGVGWRGRPRVKGIRYLHRRRRESRSFWVSGEVAMGINGDAEWIAGEENVLEKVCCFSGGEELGPFSLWEISFSVLFGSGAPGKEERETKLKEVGSAVINLGQWAWDFHVQKQLKGVEGKQSHFHAQRKQFPITVSKDGFTAEATLHVDVSFIEIEIPKENNQVATYGDVMVQSTQHEQGLDSSDGCVTDDPCSSSDVDINASQLLPMSRNEEENITSKSRRKSSRSHSSSSSNSGNSSPDLQLLSVSKHRFLPWGSKSRTKKISEERANKETQTSSSPVNTSRNNILSREHPESTEENDDPVGKWESREFISRDKRSKLRVQSFFASIDQRDESADGESACTALVTVIADFLHSNGVKMLTRSEFNALIRAGSTEWRRLCNNSSCIERFPNKHFDLDTILEAKINSISVLPEKSFVGFFQPESFELLQGAMSFDDIWNLISNDVEDVPKVYIISWNDHFFVLLLEPEACYIIDTLGERLYEGFRKAYILRFDESTQISKLKVLEDEGFKGENEEIEELVCCGKDCCREFIKRFFAAIPLREELELEEKGQGNASTVLHQRLQIELHYTVTCSNVITM